MCECKELIDNGVCDEGYIWNPSNSECKCDNSCDVGEYLQYANSKCRKRLVDKLVDECTENLEELRISENTHKYNSCTLWIVLLCFNTSYNKQWN